MLLLLLLAASGRQLTLDVSFVVESNEVVLAGREGSLGKHPIQHYQADQHVHVDHCMGAEKKWGMVKVILYNKN